MKIISYLNGSLWHFISMDEFLPEGQNLIAAFSPAIIEKYNFQGQGEAQNAQGGTGLVFQAGTFAFKGTNIPIISLEFQPSRIVIICSQSDQSRAFADDLIGFLTSSFQFRAPEREVSTFDISSLVVDFGDAFFSKIATFETIAKALNKRLDKTVVQHPPIDPESIKIGGVGYIQNHGINLQYNLEKRVSRPAGTSWLFSLAPLDTKSHVEFLKELEEIVNSGAP